MTTPKRRKSDTVDYDCKFEGYIIEMHGDIKEVVTQVKAMNGSLRETAKIANRNKDKSNKHSVYWGVLIFVTAVVSAAYIKSFF